MSFLRRCCCRCSCCFWRRKRRGHRKDSGASAAAADAEVEPVEVARCSKYFFADEFRFDGEPEPQQEPHQQQMQRNSVKLEVIAPSSNRPRLSFCGGGSGGVKDDAATSLLQAAEADEAEAAEDDDEAAAASSVCVASLNGCDVPAAGQTTPDVVKAPRPPQPPPGSLESQEAQHEALLTLMNACRRELSLGRAQPLQLDRKLSLVAMEAWRLMARSPLGFLGQRRQFDFRLVDQSPTADYGCLTFCDLAGHSPGSDCLSAAVHFWSSEGCIQMYCDAAKKTAGSATGCSGFNPEHWRQLIPWNLSDGASLADRMHSTGFLPDRHSNVDQLTSSGCTRVGFHIGWHSLPEGFPSRRPICIVAVFDAKDASVP